MSWFTMATPHSKRKLSSPRSEKKADARMQFRRTWELRTALRCSPNRYIQSLAIGLDVLVLNAESAKRQLSLITR